MRTGFFEEDSGQDSGDWFGFAARIPGIGLDLRGFWPGFRGLVWIWEDSGQDSSDWFGCEKHRRHGLSTLSCRLVTKGDTNAGTE